MIIILGRAEVDPARLSDLRDAMTDMMRATWAESGCLSYSIAVESEGSATQPAVLTIAERWADEAAIAAHMASPHMATFNRQAAGAVRSLDLKAYDVAGERALG